MLMYCHLPVKLNSKGQSLVELGLITPLLLIALYIPADFGIAMFTANLTQNAVREAARIGVTTQNHFDNAAGTVTKTEATNRLPARLASPTVTVKFYGSGGPAICLQFVEVKAVGSYNIWFYQVLRLFGGTAPNTIQITRTTRMPYQYQPINTTGTPSPLCTTATVSV